VSGQPVTLNAALAEVSAEIDRAFMALLDAPADGRARLYEAMRYSAIGGGKRMRPLLVVAGCDLFKVARERALRVALAVECIHV
jgi:farnesyl diphosphate synthase